MADEILPGLHDMLAGLPKKRVPFEQATEATYGRLYEAYEKFKALHAEAEAEVERLRKEAADLRETITLVGSSLKLVGERAEEAETERDQALIDLETAKGWRDEALDERDRQRREAAEYRQANTLLQEINTIRTAERDRLKATIDRVRAVHHLTEWVSLSDACAKHLGFRQEGPTAENIAVADACPDCQPRRYKNCVCADDECPVLAALGQPGEGTD